MEASTVSGIILALLLSSVPIIIVIAARIRNARRCDPLVPCPDCSRPISRLARFCPGCGRPNSAIVIGQSMQAIGCLITAAIGIPIAIAIVYAFMQRR